MTEIFQMYKMPDMGESIVSNISVLKLKTCDVREFGKYSQRSVCEVSSTQIDPCYLI